MCELCLLRCHLLCRKLLYCLYRPWEAALTGAVLCSRDDQVRIAWLCDELLHSILMVPTQRRLSIHTQDSCFEEPCTLLCGLATYGECLLLPKGHKGEAGMLPAPQGRVELWPGARERDVGNTCAATT